MSEKNTAFDHPLTERMRTFLRLEFLARQVEANINLPSSLASRACVISMLDMLTATSRLDVKSEIVKELEKDPGRPGKVLPANLYRRIRTLQEQGLIEETEARPDPELDDERRRYFAVTNHGMEVARAEARRLESLVMGARARDLLPR